MTLSPSLRTLVLLGGSLLLALSASAQARDPVHWAVHDTTRPLPPVVTPGPAAPPQAPPSDAVVLFSGENLDAWRHPSGVAASWIVRDGYVAVRPGSGSIQTKKRFGDVQLHLEWMVPKSIGGEGQSFGNSGILLMGKYEIQVLNSHENPTYPDGQAAAVYGQYPPLVNVTRPPGEWQTFDILFRRPHFEKNGNLVEPARVTVYHNGILVQDHVALTGPVGLKSRPPYEQHGPSLPLRLQDHNNAVRFRNIWLREL